MAKTEIDSYNQFPGSRTTTTGVGGTVTGVTTEDFPVVAFESKQRSSVNTPNFRTLHREDLPMNPFTYRSTVHRWAHGYTYQKHTASGNWTEKSGYLGIGYVNLEPREITNSLRESLRQAALGKAQRKIKDQHLSLGVTFGEARETANLLLDTARRSAVALGAASVGDWKTAVRTLWKGDVFDYYGRHKSRHGSVIQFYDRRSGNRIGSVKSGASTLVERFLELKFGWLPLYKDLYDSFEHLARLLSDRGFDVRSAASATHRFNRVEEESFEGLPIQRKEFGSVTRKYTFVYRQAYPDALLHLKQTGLTNPLAIAWQLKPLSFVFDWFLPMGRYLDLLDYDLGLSLTKACLTTFEKTTVRYNVRVAGSHSGYENYGRWKALKEVVECTRTPITAFPSVPLPAINPNPFGVERGQVAIALLKQRLNPFLRKI